MKLSVVGAGYVGLISGVGFASFGNDVTCIEKSQERVNRINSGDPVIYEEGLDAALAKVLSDKAFRATADYSSVGTSDLVLVCVGTPSGADGSIDLSFVHSAIKSIGEQLKGSDKFVSIVVKSTVVPGTTKSLASLLEDSSGKKLGVGFGLGMTPEFLREGSALSDFNKPDRVVLGSIDPKTAATLRELHSRYTCPKLETDPSTAEAIKYASNSFLSTKISFVNELANACEKFGVNVDDVAKGMGLDSRIGSQFLTAGLGFGGSCFTKDVKALRDASARQGVSTLILDSVLEVNHHQPHRTLELARNCLKHSGAQGGLEGKTVALLGLAFKPSTDDVRDSPSLVVAAELLKAGAKIRAADPKAIETFKAAFGPGSSKIVFCKDFEDAISGSSVAIVATNWPEYRQPLAAFAKGMTGKPPVVVDAWRGHTAQEAKSAGVAYSSIGGEHFHG